MMTLSCPEPVPVLLPCKGQADELSAAAAFNIFMDRHEVKQRQKGQPLSHNSVARGEPGRRYLVPGESLDKLFTLYRAALAAHAPLNLTERPAEFSPVTLDFDFRFHPLPEEVAGATQPCRHYTPDHVRHLLQAYFRALADVFVISPGTRVYVLEKPCPRVEEVGTGRGKSKLPYVKDGLHAVIPSVVTCAAAKRLVRERALPALAAVCASIGTVNAAEDVFDELAIGNDWQMYGSTKPHQPPYRVTRVYEWRRQGNGDGGPGVLEVAGSGPEPEGELVEVLSVRNKLYCSRYASGAMRAEVEQREQRERDERIARQQPYSSQRECPEQYKARQADLRAERAARKAAVTMPVVAALHASSLEQG